MTPKHLLKLRAAWSVRATPDAPPALRAWLRDRGSLTARLRARCHQFSVSVRFQGRAALLPDECSFLGISPGARALVREVVLCADGVPVVFARSVLLPRHLRTAWTGLAGLGCRPLGEALFSDPCVARGPLHFRKMPVRDLRVRRLPPELAPSVALWARRRAFVRQGGVLLVMELFLPDIARLSP